MKTFILFWIALMITVFVWDFEQAVKVEKPIETVYPVWSEKLWEERGNL